MPSASSPHTIPRLAHRRVLVVEDNDVNALVVTALLEREGAVVHRAVNGAQAVDQMQRALEAQSLYDLVLMDLQMPVMDGLEATRRIRRLCTAACPPILAITASPPDELSGSSLQAAGLDDLLLKPIRHSDFTAFVQRGLLKAGQAPQPFSGSDPASARHH